MAGSPRARGSLAGRAAALTQEEVERRRLHVRRATRDLGASSTSPRENLRGGRRLRAAPRMPTVRKRAPKDLFAPRARPRTARRTRGPGRGRRLASRPRRGPSGQLPARRRRQPRGPRGTNRRNRSAEREGAGDQGPGAGRAAGPTSSLTRPAAPSPPPQTAALRCREPEGGGRSRESQVPGARRPRRPGHVPLGQPMSPGGRSDVRATAWLVSAGPRHVAGRTPMGGAAAT